MARKPRFVLPGHPQHVTQRGVDKRATFFHERDYRYYLEWLAKACAEHDCDIHAYVLMTNHVHLLMTPHTQDSISKVMQAVGRRYVRYVNDNYDRTGPLWDGRFKPSLIDSEKYLLTCMRYIELNPVWASMVDDPMDYSWSSHRHNCGGKQDDVVTHHALYRALGNTPVTRARAYRYLFQFHINDEDLTRVRKCARQGNILGGRRFKKEIQKMMVKRSNKGVRPR